jgi:hypothetical protein
VKSCNELAVRSFVFLPAAIFECQGEASLEKILQRVREFVGLESEGPRFAFVSDAAAGVDQVDAIGPSGVGTLGGVAELVEHGGKFDSKLTHTGAGDQAALLFIFGAGENDLVLNVALHLPDVAGMSFENIDDQEGDAIAVLIKQFVKGRNLPPEWRSSVAAEDEDDRLLGRERGELDASAFVELHQGEVGCGIAGAKFAGASVRPESFERECEEDRGPWHMRHNAGEGFRWLTHRPGDEDGEAEVENHQDGQRANEKFLVSVTHPHGSHMVTGGGAEICSSFQLVRLKTGGPDSLALGGASEMKMPFTAEIAEKRF